MSAKLQSALREEEVVANIPRITILQKVRKVYAFRREQEKCYNELLRNNMN